MPISSSPFYSLTRCHLREIVMRPMFFFLLYDLLFRSKTGEAISSYSR